MATKNPLREVRLKSKRTLKEFAADCEVNYQAIYLAECGVYPHVLPRVAEYIKSIGEWSPTFELIYSQFQLEKRWMIGRTNSLSEYVSREPLFDHGHPFIVFREGLTNPKGFMSHMAFCKLFCVQPSLLNRLETGRTKHLFEQLRQALSDAGLPAIVIQELETRCEEYVSGSYSDSG